MWMNRSWRLIVLVINEHLTEANTCINHQKTDWITAIEWAPTAQLLHVYSIIPIESTRQIEINFGCVFIFIICGVTWWYIKYIQFVRGHAYSKRGRVYGKGGVNWVWLAKKIETFKSTFWHKITEKSLEPLPSPAPNLEQNITWILWENV